MAHSNENWIENIEDVRLPALTHSKRSLDALLNRPATSNADLAAIIGLDPGLSMQLFRELGERPQQPAEPVIDPSRIISLLGMNAVYSMAAKVPNLEERYRGPALEGLKESYARAILASCFARLLTRLRARSQNEEMAITALLQGLGELALWSRRPGTMKLLMNKIRRREDLDSASMRRFEARPADLGVNLARHWHLPENIVRAQLLHNSLDANTLPAILSAELAWSVHQGWDSMVSAELLSLAADYVHLEMDILRPALHRECAIAARLCHARGLPNAAEPLVRVKRNNISTASTAPTTQTEAKPQAREKPTVAPQGQTTPSKPKFQPKAKQATESQGPTPTATKTEARKAVEPPQQSATASKPQAKEQRATEAQQQTVTATKSRQKTPIGKSPVASERVTESRTRPATANKPVKNEPRPNAASPSRPVAQAAPQRPAAADTPAKADKSTATVDKPKTNPLQLKLDQAFTDLLKETELRRLMFVMRSPDHKSARTRIVMGESCEPLRGFSAPTKTKNLFALLLLRPHHLWVNSGNLVKYLPLIPEQSAHLISTRGFFACSVMAKKIPIGIVYADANNGELHQKDFEYFKIACKKIGKLFDGSG